MTSSLARGYGDDGRGVFPHLAPEIAEGLREPDSEAQRRHSPILSTPRELGTARKARRSPTAQAAVISISSPQGVIRFEMPEDTLPADHRARLIWRVLQTLDLAEFTAKSKAVEGRAGRNVLSPAMLLTLWLYAVSVGVGSAREIARRTKSDDAFRWIVGDQDVGHAALSAFRVGHGQRSRSG